MTDDVDAAIARVRAVLTQHERPAGGTFGTSDSALLVAMADLVVHFVRWTLERAVRAERARR